MSHEEYLIEKAQEGDHEAFRQLFKTHVQPLYRFLSRFSKERDQVEEWVQRAFIKAFEYLPGFHGASRFSTWLFRLGVNEMKMDKRRTATLSFVSFEDDGHPSGDNQTDEFEWNDTMHRWLDETDEKNRAVFILHEVEGYSHAEIGTILGIPESSSRTALTRTRRLLRQKWEQERKAV